MDYSQVLWIPVTSLCPEEDGEWLVTLHSGRVTLASYAASEEGDLWRCLDRDDEDEFFITDPVMAWAELPAPYHLSVCGSAQFNLQSRVEEIRKKYPAGTRVQVDQMADDPRPIPPGTKATVASVDDIGTIHCDFDNGRQLGLIIGADRFHEI